ncbi:MAG TPA: hypothetical protein PKA00_20595 [Saprospiraceae bacterium]|nr:hypothetical protein [Saprospiraceae bacterium]HMQ85322.1 hypothetical protein [Saprospiraceae bacterium]
MYHRQFERAARLNRSKAIFFTLVFHVILLGALASGSKGDWQKYLPSAVQDLFGMEQSEEVVGIKP